MISMTEAERVTKLKQALIAARWSLAWWAYHPAYSWKRERVLLTELAKLDSVIDEPEVNL